MRETVKRNGFTLIELVVTVAIVSVLAASAIPLAELSLRRQKEGELRAALRDIRTAIDSYREATKSGQVAKSVDASGYPKKLDDLVTGAVDAKDPKQRKIYFLRRLPRDPFYAGPAVPAAETWGKRSYASPPDTPAEGEDVFDVYSLHSGTGMNGVPYREW